MRSKYLVGVTFLILLITAGQSFALPWDLTGTWGINVEYLGTDYPETLILTQSGTAITGVSLNTNPPAGGSAFTIISGSVIGNTVEIFADHDTSSTVVHMTGTIASDGLSMSGDWHDEAPGIRTDTWETTSGAAKDLGDPGQEIPEFPTAALPAVIAVGGYLMLRRRKQE